MVNNIPGTQWWSPRAMKSFGDSGGGVGHGGGRGIKKKGRKRNEEKKGDVTF